MTMLRHPMQHLATLAPGWSRPALKRADVTRRGPKPHTSICFSSSSKLRESSSTVSLGPGA
jgi:hypothetical protein